MLSVPDMAIIGAIALLVFGPEQLPKVARKFGTIMRDVQNTSQQFIREMERAADENETPADRHLDHLPAYDPLASDYASLPGVESETSAHPDYEPPLPGFEVGAEAAPEPPPPRKPPAEPVEF